MHTLLLQPEADIGCGPGEGATIFDVEPSEFIPGTIPILARSLADIWPQSFGRVFLVPFGSVICEPAFMSEGSGAVTTAD
jgi:hypothetical protein